MPSDLQVKWARFDELFAQLLGTLKDRESSRSDQEAALTVIDATHRLHRIRADLAIARCVVTRDDPNHPCVDDEPTSVRSAGSADLRAIPSSPPTSEAR